MKMRIGRWFRERLPVSTVMGWALNEEITGGSRWAYVFGSSTLFLLAVQVLTGILQLVYYVPTTDHAYDSLMYLRLRVSFGWLVHGLHYWGANAFIVALVLHTGRVFIWGAYKKPRELTWLVGALLFLASLVVMFTGALLAWDQLGYWAAAVGTNMAETVPLIGRFLKALARGGSAMGQLTLSRFFTFHVAVLPVVLAVLTAIHLSAFRQYGSVGPWDPGKRSRTGRFWPDQVLKDALAVSVIFAALVALCAYVPAQISGPADPLDDNYQPKPIWLFLFLYQALKGFPGRWEPVGTVAVPLALTLLLFVLPFVDRREERNPARRPAVMTLAFVLAAGILTLTILGAKSKPGRLNRAQTTALIAKTAPPAAPAYEASVKEGQKLFAQLACSACHMVNGVGGTLGSDLSGEGAKGRTAEWLLAQLQDPKAFNPDSIMPSFSSAGKERLENLVDYLLTLKGVAAATPAPARPIPAAGTGPGPAAAMIGNAALGGVIFVQYCAACHGDAGRGGVGAIPPLKPIKPTLKSPSADEFAANIDVPIQHGSAAVGPAPTITMPAFGDDKSLTQQQISAVEAYVLKLDGVDRAQITNPGVEPHVFAWGTIGAFVAAWLVTAIVYVRLRCRPGFQQGP